MLTYQDYLKAPNKLKWIGNAIASYMRSDPYKLAKDADEYEAQRNVTINEMVRKVYDATGKAAADPLAANNKIPCNYFHRLNNDRCQYSLGNGISFPGEEVVQEDGTTVQVDTIKEQLGDSFDTELQKAAYLALIHGDSYLYDNGDRYYVFPKTQFLPLPDEETGAVRAGLRFWSLEWRKRPIRVELYEEDGITKYATEPGKYGLGALQEVQAKRAYKQIVEYSEADGEEVVVDEQNYGEIPIIPVYANSTRQSTLVGLRPKIDAYDMIQSGYANDLQECAQIYWLINNAMGMDDNDIAQLRDRLLFQHMAVVDAQNSSVVPYTQEVPYNAREACLHSLRSAMYEDFGALDVHTVAAGATNDHIEAGYQPMDEEADAFEYQIIQAVQQCLKIRGIEPVVPQFKRNRISNQMEQTQMVLLAAQYLDAKTILSKLPFVTVDEISEILANQVQTDAERFELEQEETETE